MGIVIWLVISVIVGVLAHTRGRNVIGWTLLAALISPLIAGILVFVLPNPKEEQARREAEMDEMLEMSRANARRQETQNGKASKVKGPDLVLSLVQLKQLREKNVVNDEEYAERKLKLISGLEKKKLDDTPENLVALMVPLVENGTLTGDDLKTIKDAVWRQAS